MQLDLNELAGGALAERIEIEFNKMAANIADPNTKATSIRELMISIKIKPDEDREIGLSEMTVKTKLAPARGLPTRFVIDQNREGKAVMKELASGAVKNQLRIDDTGNVTDHAGKAPELKAVASNVVQGPFK